MLMIPVLFTLNFNTAGHPVKLAVAEFLTGPLNLVGGEVEARLPGKGHTILSILALPDPTGEVLVGLYFCDEPSG